MSLARDLINRVFFPDRDVHGIPVLDGGFSPNERLDLAQQCGTGFDAPDALAFDDDDRLYVSSGRTVFVCSNANADDPRPFAQFDADAGALAWSRRSGLLVCVANRGIVALGAKGDVVMEVNQVAGEQLRCATAIALAADGTVFVTDGSRHNVPREWLRDLMQNREGSGRVISFAPDFSHADVLADGLSWPNGVVVAHDEAHVLVSESWTHRLTSYRRLGGQPRILVRNFAGYPCRITRGAQQDYWIAFFALRTQLMEFVLREKGFRERMMAAIPPELWVGPSLGGTLDYRAPNQIGRIKKLGIQKPWAPPRSYGLVARLDGEGHAIESLHSRASGHFHGVTSVLCRGGRVQMASKGHGKIAALEASPAISGDRQ